MRVLFVWLVGITLIFVVSVGWYVSQPLVIGMSRSLNSSITNPSGRNVMTAIEYVSFLWGPVFDIFILLWMFISMQKRDVESEVYG